MGSLLDHRIPPPLVGATVAAAGMAFDLAGLLAFRASRTIFNPLKPQRTSALVTGGVYRITRNPMYVGLALLLLAWAVFLAALLPLLGASAAGAVPHALPDPAGRARAAQMFGAEYAAYAARVQRWL